MQVLLCETLYKFNYLILKYAASQRKVLEKEGY